jgi:hypothetical protein
LIRTNQALDRSTQRLERDARHPVHPDTAEPDILAAEVKAKGDGAIPLPVPTLIVHSDDGRTPSSLLCQS